MHTFLLFFSWPAGGVWSNLIASAITAPVGAAAGGALVWGRAQAHLCRRDQQHHADLVRQLAAHHQALAEHITAATAPQRGDPS